MWLKGNIFAGEKGSFRHCFNMPNSGHNDGAGGCVQPVMDDAFVTFVDSTGDVAFLPQFFAGFADHAFGFSDS